MAPATAVTSNFRAVQANKKNTILPDNERLEITTFAQGRDLERCRRLCDSVDRFVPVRIRHTEIVPPRDYQRFVPLQGGRRSVLMTREVLPGSFKQLFAGDDMWIDRHGWPVSAWIMQQLLKLGANRATEAELLMFADADLQFLCNFDVSAYTLYGSFVEHFLAEDCHGHFYDCHDPCHCFWFDYQAMDLLEGRCAVPARAVALKVQPNIRLVPAQELAVFAAARGERR